MDPRARNTSMLLLYREPGKGEILECTLDMLSCSCQARRRESLKGRHLAEKYSGGTEISLRQNVKNLTTEPPESRKNISS